MSTMFERITRPSGICDSCRSAGRTTLPGPNGAGDGGAGGGLPVSKYWADRQDGKPFAAQVCLVCDQFPSAPHQHGATP